MKPAIVPLVFLVLFSLRVSSQNDVVFIPEIDALVQDQYPEEKISIIMLANNSDLRLPVLTKKIADIVLKDKLAPKSSKKSKKKRSNKSESKVPLNVPNDIMNLLKGKYYSPELNFQYEFFIENERLFCRIGNNKLNQVRFISKNHFLLDEYINLSPIWEDTDVISSFTLSVGDSKNIVFERVGWKD